MAQPARQWFTFREYVEIEEMCSIKHEFLDGQVWAMAGGTPDHAAIGANVSALLALALRGQRCRVFSSDLRIRVKPTGLGTYPDVSVVCGALELDPEDHKGHTVVNPRVVVEVLSPSTEAYDRSEKLEHYQRIESLEEIVLVAHDERRIDVWRRTAEGWSEQRVHGDQTVELRSLGVALPLVEVYRDPLADAAR